MEEVFEISISSRENRTWQGTLRAQGEAIPFHSELELLLALARLLPPEGMEIPDLREWRAGPPVKQEPM